MVALGFAIAQVLRAQTVHRTLEEASESARLIARIGIEPRLSPRDLAEGLTPHGVQALDEQLRDRSVNRDLARIKIWNTEHRIIYSDDHQLIGRSYPNGSDEELESALAGHPDDAAVVRPSANNETASEVGLGQPRRGLRPPSLHSCGPAGRGIRDLSQLQAAGRDDRRR